MLEIKGKVNTAICYASVIEEEAIGQIRRMCDYEFTAGAKYLVIHSGSRNLGKQVAEIYQRLAVDLNRGMEDYFKQRDEIIRTYKEQGRRSEIQAALKEIAYKKANGPTTIPEDLCYVYRKYFEDYLADVEICQQFARRNRELIAEIILGRCGLTAKDAFHTIHNYIDTDEMILRKGNPEWNYSAPHGAGRIMSRAGAKEKLTMEEYKKEMEGIYTTSVNEDTLDEAPMAYKSLGDIIDVIGESVEVIEVLKPIFNYKASEPAKFGKDMR